MKMFNEFADFRSLGRGLAAAALLAAVTAASASQAGVMRHDGYDSDHLDLGASLAYESVGRITGSTSDFNFSASATLIGGNWALTAAHVVDGATALTFDIGGKSYAADSWVAHSKWNGSLGGGYDIGLIHFADDLVLDTGIDAAELYAGSREIGQVATAVGFGMTGTGATGAIVFDGQKRAGQNMIDAVLQTPGRGNRILLSDFDNPGDSTDSSWGSSDPLGLEYLIAPGDSGGGLFADFGAGDVLIGIHSFGWGLLDGNPDSDYGDASGHTRVSSFIKWIDDILNPSSSKKGGSGPGNGKGGGKKTTMVPTFMISPIPEPTSLAIFGVGLVALGWVRRRRIR